MGACSAEYRRAPPESVAWRSARQAGTTSSRSSTLIGAQNRAALGVAGIRVEHLRSEWEQPDFRLGEDNIVAVDGGRVVGYAAVTPEGSSCSPRTTRQLADALFERMPRGRASAATRRSRCR